ncbi:HTH domain-containing protein, Cro/C1-type [Desulfonema limicola]|uniref:HTH domain-containing protein, Cro/C1-type n=1 Tax=Desulfonema limicola TaxID=45656 RepID=A0A975BEZ8_9BACT|nr:helix-turn-helix transcriptional regulator [Desulfonema limicola]QTA83890.1 HTH domain-containing protein, Cro/C1-type [Desulfonema limicola]
MNAKNIKEAVKAKGMTIKKLSKEIGYTRSHVSNVIHGHHESPRVRKAISDLLGKTPQQLWAKTAA